MNMDSKESSGGGELSRVLFSVPGLTILVSVAALLFARTQFQLARPPNEHKSAQDLTTELKSESRSWQDPFPAAVRIADNEADAKLGARSLVSIDTLARSLAEATVGSNRLKVVATLVNGSPYPHGTEMRLRTRLALQSAMRASGFVRLGGDFTPYFVLPAWNTPKKWLEWINPTNARPPSVGSDMTTVPYEWFKPDMTVPSEGSVYDRVLVLWLKEDEFNPQPFERFATLLAGVLERAGSSKTTINTTNVELAILGPRSSGGLQSMVEDRSLSGAGRIDWMQTPSRSNAVNIVRAAQIVSTSASAPDVFFLPQRVPEKADDESWEPHTDFWPRGRIAASIATNLPGSRFHQFGTTDDELCFLLLAELGMRGVDLRTDKIVLLSEYDTFYGRSLPITFKAALQTLKMHSDLMPKGRESTMLFEALRPKCATEAVATNSTVDYPTLLRDFEASVHGLRKSSNQGPSNVVQFSFLAGVDGSKTILDNPKKSDNEKRQDGQPDYLERPEGEQQLDYIRRLASELGGNIQSLLQTNEAGGKVVAVGLLGNDFYDKLLLLQSLRKQLPGAIFFTTDLDSRLLVRSQQSWTRNVITASAYDLSLPEGTSGLRLAPFRDGYQTALFIGCRWILNTNFALPCSAPAAYEIGRQSPHRLASPTISSREPAFWSKEQWLDHLKLAPRIVTKSPALLAGIGGFLAIGLITLLPPVREKKSRMFVRLMIGIGCLAGLCVAAMLLWIMFRDGLEPLNVGDGVSAFSSAVLLSLAVGVGGLALLALDKFENLVGDITRSLRFVLGIVLILVLTCWCLWEAPFPVRGPDTLFRWLFITAWCVCGVLTVCIVVFWQGFYTRAKDLLNQIAGRIDGSNKFISNTIDEVRVAYALADDTARYGRLLSYPMIVILLIILASSSWLDSWIWTPWMVVLMTLEVALLVIYPIILQRISTTIRTEFRHRLHIHQAQNLITAGIHIDGLTSLVDGLDGGCFGPLAKQPVFGALAWVIGGSGIVSVLQPLIGT